MDWKEKDNSLQASFSFEDFKQAFAFMTECAMHIEQANHHPEWSNVYNEVEIKLTTHDEGNTVTDKDRKLSKKISACYAKYE